MARRVVVTHKDGRRVSVDEDDFDVTAGNPFNQAADIHEFDGNTGETVIRRKPAKAEADRRSLKAEGFKIEGLIHGEGHTADCPKDCEMLLGHEFTPKGGVR